MFLKKTSNFTRIDGVKLEKILVLTARECFATEINLEIHADASTCVSKFRHVHCIQSKMFL